MPYSGGTQTAKSTIYLINGLIGEEERKSDVLLCSFPRRRRFRKSTGSSMLRGRSHRDVTTDTASNVGRSVTSSVTSSASLGTGTGSWHINITGITLHTQNSI